jgi:glycosyltransferase involved in cell wall biosynthesis
MDRQGKSELVTVIIPARNEVYLKKTIDNVLSNSTGEIEIIVVLDGYRPELSIKDGRVKFIYNEIPNGQRRSINQAAEEAKGKFIMKLDAHCAVAPGFDTTLSNDCEYEWTMVPRMFTLDRETWTPKLHKRVDYMYISSPTWKEPFRMQYYEGRTEKDEKQRQPKNDIEIDDIMCCMGSCFFMHKDRFRELGGCDENHGGWGQQGIEVALKAWLSGGALKVNKKTWFAHMHRGEGFPYLITNGDVDKARNYSQDLWLNDKWPAAKRPLSWVTDKFKAPHWHEYE